MKSKSIEWEISEQSFSQDLISKDHRWHISKKQTGHNEPEFFMSNFDLLLTPHGTGTDYRECFETFIADCDTFVEQVKKIKAEAERPRRRMGRWVPHDPVILSLEIRGLLLEQPVVGSQSWQKDQRGSTGV